jgi:hypothetical protein
MTKAHRINSKGTTEKYADAIAKLHSPGDYVLVVRGTTPRSIVMVCPDGCGENITVNLDRRIGKAWRKYERNGNLSVYPSVWRDTGCRAHFIVWNDQILWSGTRDASDKIVQESLITEVYKTLSPAQFAHYEVIAETLQAIPWEALWACRELVRRNHAAEGERGTFRRVGNEGNQPQACGRIDILA